MDEVCQLSRETNEARLWVWLLQTIARFKEGLFLPGWETNWTGLIENFTQ